MPYQVEVDWAPAYEFLMSLFAYKSYRGQPRKFELGAEWVNQVKACGGRTLADALAISSDDHGPLEVLVLLAPEPRSAESFTDWLSELSPTRMYELFQQYGAGGHIPRLSEVEGIRDRYVALLRVWNEVYFQSIDVGILTGLANEAAAKRALLLTEDPVMVVEAATNGVWLEPIDVPKRIVLIPQHHMRPWNIIGEGGGVSTFHYAADVLPLAEGELPPALNRLTRALDDANRLHILRYLADAPHTFTEVVQFSGLAKSTVHYHMVLLRAAGLVRLHSSGGDGERYSLRPGAVEALSGRLVSFLKGE
jgi:DNA-binding transcriptional ArsR family regulator